MKQAIWLACLLLAGLASGCASGKPRTYDVLVTNDTQAPITVWLTKDGPPPEQGWYSPEDLALIQPDDYAPLPGWVLMPGEQASTGPVTGRFEPKTRAVLRVYTGQLRFAEILARSRNRLDVTLAPGRNSLAIVQGQEQKLQAQRQPIEP
jgi:hypothetical protein